MDGKPGKDGGAACVRLDAQMSGVTVVEIDSGVPVKDCLEAMVLAKKEATDRLDDFMLMSWYDRDRNFESPQHTSESNGKDAVPGYVYYGLNHGATLKVDVEKGRFVFFFTPVDLS